MDTVSFLQRGERGPTKIPRHIAAIGELNRTDQAFTYALGEQYTRNPVSFATTTMRLSRLLTIDNDPTPALAVAA